MLRRFPHCVDVKVAIYKQSATFLSNPHIAEKFTAGHQRMYTSKGEREPSSSQAREEPSGQSFCAGHTQVAVVVQEEVHHHAGVLADAVQGLRHEELLGEGGVGAVEDGQQHVLEEDPELRPAQGRSARGGGKGKWKAVS